MEEGASIIYALLIPVSVIETTKKQKVSLLDALNPAHYFAF